MVWFSTIPYLSFKQFEKDVQSVRAGQYYPPSNACAKPRSPTRTVPGGGGPFLLAPPLYLVPGLRSYAYLFTGLSFRWITRSLTAETLFYLTVYPWCLAPFLDLKGNSMNILDTLILADAHLSLGSDLSSCLRHPQVLSAESTPYHKCLT